MLKIFDLTFLMKMLKHQKLKEEHACQIYALFSAMSLEDTSYAAAAHDIMIVAIQRFVPQNTSGDLN